jgi:1-deoxy-D-xylulose-5-phosphate synthase
MQPRDEAMLARMITTALGHGGPSVIRYPRDPGPDVARPDAPAAIPIGTAEVLLEPDNPADVVWIWALGDMLTLAREVAGILKDTALAAGIVDPRFVKPIDLALLQRQAPTARLYVTLENSAVTGGFGSAVQTALASAGLAVPVMSFGWPDVVIGQGTTTTLRKVHGLTAETIAATILGALAARPA